MRVNIVVNQNGFGLSRNAMLLSEVLGAAGFDVTVNPVRYHAVQNANVPRILRRSAIKAGYRFFLCYQKGMKWLERKKICRPAYDINIFFEFVVPQWMSHARVNCLVPNQEWFRDYAMAHVSDIDLVLCKTRCAQKIFEDLGCRAEYTSFTSMDRLDEERARDCNAFFHLAGNNIQKGTGGLIDLWERHPEWPMLRVVQKKGIREVRAKNIDYIVGYLDDAKLREYQNLHGIHLCPSEVEGFGHSIVEAMSCGAVVLSTDAAPMNEVVSSERGVLVDYHKSEPQSLGMRYFVDPADLERKVEGILNMDDLQKKRLGEKAREWYRENDDYFKRRVVEVIKGI